MKTGLIGDLMRRRCPKCGILSAGMETICVVCKTPFDKPRATVQAQAAAGKLWQRVYDNRGFIILALIALGVLWLYKNRDKVGEGASSALQGEDRAAVGKRVEDFAEALKHRNFELLGQLIWVEGRTLRPEDVKKIWTVVTSAESAEDTLDSVATEIKPTDNGFYVYAVLVVRPAKPEKTGGTDPAGGIDTTGIPGLGGAGAPKTRTEKMTWKWKRFDGKWYYVDPVK